MSSQPHGDRLPPSENRKKNAAEREGGGQRGHPGRADEDRPRPARDASCRRRTARRTRTASSARNTSTALGARRSSGPPSSEQADPDQRREQQARNRARPPVQRRAQHDKERQHQRERPAVIGPVVAGQRPGRSRASVIPARARPATSSTVAAPVWERALAGCRDAQREHERGRAPAPPANSVPTPTTGRPCAARTRATNSVSPTPAGAKRGHARKSSPARPLRSC